MDNKLYLNSFRDCFNIDAHKFNKVPKSIFKKYYLLILSQRYSMTVYLRLTEYFFSKYKIKKRRIYKFLADYFRRKNETKNNFEHGYVHNIFPGTLFHHTGLTIVQNTRVEKNVQLFKNVTLALNKGRTCEIGENTVIFSHVIILGKKIGKNCVIGAGAVVNSDIPDNSIAVGVPAKVIGECDNSYEFLEFQ